MLNSEFEERCINYLSPAFSYNKSSQHHHNMSMEVSMVEESFMVFLFLLGNKYNRYRMYQQLILQQQEKKNLQESINYIGL